MFKRLKISFIYEKKKKHGRSILLLIYNEIKYLQGTEYEFLIILYLE